MSYWEHDDAIRSMLRRARRTKTDDSGDQQLVDLYGMFGDRPKKIVSHYPFGFGANAPLNSDGILLALGGRSDRLTFLDGGHKNYRQKDMPEGTSKLYDKSGNIIFAAASNGIQVSAKEGKITVKPGDGQNVYLGGDGSGGGYSKVVTLAGPSANVFAKV